MVEERSEGLSMLQGEKAQIWTRVEIKGGNSSSDQRRGDGEQRNPGDTRSVAEIIARLVALCVPHQTMHFTPEVVFSFAMPCILGRLCSHPMAIPQYQPDCAVA